MGGWYEPTKRRAVKGGIRSQSKTRDFGNSWWAKRWIATLESFDIGSRLARGRSYARSGQVLTITIESGVVKAKVQGSRSTPYTVTIKISTLAESDWQCITETLATQALYAAKLLAGEMPEDIEEAFERAGHTLFPASAREIDTDCSCPDWSNPCKHTAAVYYLLGEEFDRDPFLMFQLRGKAREPFLAMLNTLGGSATESRQDTADSVLPAEPLATSPEDFWNGCSLTDNLFGEVAIPPVQAALVRRLGSFPFWRGDMSLLDALTPAYTRASNNGLAVFCGDGDIDAPNLRHRIVSLAPVDGSKPGSGDASP